MKSFLFWLIVLKIKIVLFVMLEEYIKDKELYNRISIIIDRLCPLVIRILKESNRFNDFKYDFSHHKNETIYNVLESLCLDDICFKDYLKFVFYFYIVGYDWKSDMFDVLVNNIFDYCFSSFCMDDDIVKRYLIINKMIGCLAYKRGIRYD